MTEKRVYEVLYVEDLLKQIERLEGEIEHLTATRKTILQTAMAQAGKLKARIAELEGDNDHLTKSDRVWLEANQRKDREIERLEGALRGLECDAEWCGKSPHGTPGKRGYDDGKCQVCKAKQALGGEDDD